MVFGSMPASLTCEAKFVIWATTRHGAVTGETRSRLSTGTVSRAVGGGVDGRAVGQQLAGGGRGGGDFGCAGGGLDPPGVVGAKDREWS